MNNQSSNPYVNARLEYEGLTHNMNVARRNWQRMCFLLAVALSISAAGNVIQATKSRVEVHVVDLDKFGRAAAIGVAEQARITDDRVIRAFVYRYIDMARSVIADGPVMKKNLREVYDMSIPSVQANVLNVFYQENDPFAYASKGTKYVEPLSFLKQSENTYMVEWREIERDYDNKVVSEKTYKGLVSVVQIPPTSRDKLKANPMNPFGFYVTSMSWTLIQ
jgi:type IV secretion system protein VirB5